MRKADVNKTAKTRPAQQMTSKLKSRNRFCFGRRIKASTTMPSNWNYFGTHRRNQRIKLSRTSSLLLLTAYVQLPVKSAQAIRFQSRQKCNPIILEDKKVDDPIRNENPAAEMFFRYNGI
ncbi:uncharacterized protein LOC129741305 [Uranotaenia lowii]|uniref:uncharacterized protein LOC129741305 n=1 Tax=Uranotaenia lowii TaxID=190385 RepID=UPI002478CED4|nr:uncharacterized protein LOC129741305 [Uranotaenia lowii]